MFSVHWYGHVLSRGDSHVLRRVFDFEVEGQRKKGRRKRTWKKQIEEDSVKVDLRRKYELCRSKWSVGVNLVAAGLSCIWLPSLVWDTTRFETLVSLKHLSSIKI